MIAVEGVAAVAMAAANDLNNDLTVVLSAVALALGKLEPGHPVRALLLDAQGAAQRCTWKTSGLLHYAGRLTTRRHRVACSMERLIENLKLTGN